MTKEYKNIFANPNYNAFIVVLTLTIKWK